jgi:hypothetical protein
MDFAVGPISSLFGTRVVESSFALKATEIRNFPVSRHRSERIRKKLMRRFGSEFRMAPALFKLPDGSILGHPTLVSQLRARLTTPIPATAA